ncbi:MAG: hypothetical protein M1812_002037 [Candelaria pacifica]|nr:MAG: hypothetical protein M1812_002037 [Candelaria pacifica]
MAGPGGGPPRRSHTKSRKGCKTCKRRHIRCDENFPQCRNCTKHSCKCDYMDAPVPGQERSLSPQLVNLLWTPEVEREIELWQQSGRFPFPELRLLHPPLPQDFSTTDLRLIHHVSSVSKEMHYSRCNKFTVWTEKIPSFLSIASSHPFVMHSILAFSATHLAWLTKSSETNNIAYHHRGIALGGLQEAIGDFSKANSDATLAASILLSWQATESRGWTSLMQGTSSVIDAMVPWKHESSFADFMDEHTLFTNPQTSPTSLLSPSSLLPTSDGLSTLKKVHRSLQRVQPFVIAKTEQSKVLDELISFVRGLRESLNGRPAEEQFEVLRPLRDWLFWLPVSFLQHAKNNLYALVVLAHFYAVALAVEPLFPAIGDAYFGSMAITPIEEIAQTLISLQASHGYREDIQAAIMLMEFPQEIVAITRQRMTWEPELTESHAASSNSPYSVQNFQLDVDADFSEVAPIPETAFNPGNENVLVNQSSSHNIGSATVAGRKARYLQAPSQLSLEGHDFDTFQSYYAGNSPAYSVSYSPSYVEEEVGEFYYSSPPITPGFVPPPVWT